MDQGVVLFDITDASLWHGLLAKSALLCILAAVAWLALDRQAKWHAPSTRRPALQRLCHWYSRVVCKRSLAVNFHFSRKCNYE
jgi:hypothetical protein